MLGWRHEIRDGTAASDVAGSTSEGRRALSASNGASEHGDGGEGFVNEVKLEEKRLAGRGTGGRNVPADGRGNAVGGATAEPNAESDASGPAGARASARGGVRGGGRGSVRGHGGGHWSPAPQYRTTRAIGRLAIVLYGKIGSMQSRSVYPFSKASAEMIALSYSSLRQSVIEPARKLFQGVDVIGHSWSPEASELISELFRPVASSFEYDLSRQLEHNCSRDAQNESHGGPGEFFPMSCGRTMSQMLGIQRAIRLKSAHETARGFRYSAVLLSRWDVLWMNGGMGAWLASLASTPHSLDEFWLPEQCVHESTWRQHEPDPRGIAKISSEFHNLVCGEAREERRAAPNLVPQNAVTCSTEHRACQNDLQKSTRGLYLLDWWFASSSALADDFALAFDRFEEYTRFVKRNLTNPAKVAGSAHPPDKPPDKHQRMSGLWLFGHFYWGLHILSGLNASVSWAPLSVGIDFTLARFFNVQIGGKNGGCRPTKSQLEAAAKIMKLDAIPEFYRDDSPMIEPEAAYVAGTSRLSPLTNGCSINPAFGRARQFTCSYGSRACATSGTHGHARSVLHRLAALKRVLDLHVKPTNVCRPPPRPGAGGSQYLPFPSACKAAVFGAFECASSSLLTAEQDKCAQKLNASKAQARLRA